MHPRQIMGKLKMLYTAVEHARKSPETMANLDKRRVAERRWAQAQVTCLHCVPIIPYKNAIRMLIAV